MLEIRNLPISQEDTGRSSGLRIQQSKVCGRMETNQEAEEGMRKALTKM